MRVAEPGGTPFISRCTPSHAAQHGPGGGQPTVSNTAVIHVAHSLVRAPSIRRLCSLLLFSLLPLSAMSADKLDVFPGERPLASEVLEWIRANKPRLSADNRALADGYMLSTGGPMQAGSGTTPTPTTSCTRRR